MPVIILLLLTALIASADTRQYLREIKLDKNCGFTAPPVEAGTVLDDKLVATLAETERELLRQQGYRDPTVTPEIIPVKYGTADLYLHSDPGPRTVITEFHFTGDPVLPEAQLARALQATRTHRVWHVFWLSHPPFADAAIDNDAQNLKSFYYSRGYFDADVQPDGVKYDGEKAVVTYRVSAGRRYELTTPVQEICRCLLDQRREAEKQGRLDFRAELQVAPALTTNVQTGDPVHVGRIEFNGNQHFSDASIRRAMVLDEGALFDRGKLRQSIARVNQLGFFEPVTADGVRITRHAEDGTADIHIALKEKKRGKWSISGPVGPPSFAGDLDGTVSMRLPLSNWFASASWVAFDPLAKYLPFLPTKPWIPIIALQRPLIPGQTWTSGVSFSPMLGWQGMLLSYAASHVGHEGKVLLGLNRVAAPELAVPVEGRSGSVICKPPKPVLWWMRAGAGMALDFATRSYMPGAL